MKFEDLRRFVKNAMAPLKRKVDLMVSRAVLSSVKNADPLQLLQLKLLADEVADDAEHFQEFGFRSKPPQGSEGIALSVGGNREHLVVVATLNRAAIANLPAMAYGESQLFSSTGNYIHVKTDDIDINAIARIVANIVGDLDLTVGGKTKINSTDNIETQAPKYKFENASHELIAVLVEWITQDIANKNITGIGPQPMDPGSIAAMNAIKTKLESFKV